MNLNETIDSVEYQRGEVKNDRTDDDTTGNGITRPSSKHNGEIYNKTS